MRYFLIVCFLLTCCNVSFAEKYVFATHAKPPTSDLSQKLYTELFKRMGHTFEQKLLPGIRVLIDVNRGIYDGDSNRIKK